MSRRRSLLAALALCGSVLAIQVGWLIVIPPFGGMDEFDHAYRAVSVAQGHIAVDAPQAKRGYGDLIRVPADIPAAAHHACAVLAYTRHDNCNAVTPPDQSGQVLIASSAARYNPAYYAVVGAVARPFRGDDALYAMRLVTMGVSDVFLFVALTVALARSRSLWPTAGILVTLTPVLVEATTIAAPNGVELAAALAMWTGGLSYVYASRNSGGSPKVLWLIALSGGAVDVTHTTGPLWVLCFVCAVGALLGRSGIHSMFRRHRKTALGTGSLLAALTAVAIGWTLWRGTNDPNVLPVTNHRAPTVTEYIAQAFLWVLQCVGGVPFRDQPSPSLVFAIGFWLFFLFTSLATVRALSRQRLVSCLIVCIAFAVPLALTMATFSRIGFSWQGRYTLPLTVGLPLLAGWTLEHRLQRPRLASVWCFVTATGVVAMQFIAIWHVRGVERNNWPHFESSPVVLGSLAITALLFLCLAVLATGRRRSVPPSNFTPATTPEPARA